MVFAGGVFHQPHVLSSEILDRGNGKTRAAGDELRTASQALKGLEQHVPEFYRALLAYPGSKPVGFEERFRWRKIDAQGTPTVVLDHAFWMPTGGGFVAAQRQFYVNRGFNAEQAVAALLPSGKSTMLVYVNHTSTDQVTGFSGGTKRSIGSKLLASQLEALFEEFPAVSGGS